MPWHRRIEQILSFPPRVLWRKVCNKIKNYLKQVTGRLYARRFGTKISDTAFLRALDNRFSTIQDFLDHLATREAHRFFLEPTRRREFIATIRAVCPDAASLTIAAADRVCEHIFDLLGSGLTHLGKQIDWHTDFKTGYHFNPKQYYTNIRPAAYPGGYDIKIPWELSRCQHFTWLGQAYWFTGSEKYAQEFVTQVLDWIEQNPPQFGVNWACTMDVAIRAVNWLWGYHFFKDSLSFTDEFLLAFLKSLLAHGRHIIKNLERTKDFTNNHYLSNLVGLVYLGILLPEFKEAQRWRVLSLQELEKEMFKQVYVDGVNFEASVSYHRLATELFLSAVILARMNGHTFSDAFMERLEKMIEFTMYVTKPDGTVPLIGDNDNGRIHRLQVWPDPAREWQDHRYLLGIGATLFERNDFGQIAGDQWAEAFWLLGKRALQFKSELDDQSEPPLPPTSCAFPHSRLYIMAHQDLYLSCNAGANGQHGCGGHAHNDKLSITLHTCGQDWLIDPGTLAYTSDYRSRDLYRSTKLHNTIQIDEKQQNRFDKDNLFHLMPDAQCTVYHWESTTAYDLLDVGHNGYARLPDPVYHRRQIFFSKKDFLFWIIRDTLSGNAKHNIASHWHIGDVETSLVNPLTILLKSTKVTDHCMMVCPLVQKDFTLTTQNSVYAPGYGQQCSGTLLSYTKTVPLPTDLITIFWPCSSDDNPEHVIHTARKLAQPVYEKLQSMGEC